jgi:hypothetical protein
VKSKGGKKLEQWEEHEKNLREYRRIMNKKPREKCPFCGTDCQSDCQHSRRWRGEVGEHGETIG